MENPFEELDNRLKNIECLLEELIRKINDDSNYDTPPKILNLTQLSAYLNISKSHIYKLTSANKIPHSKKGKLIYFEKEKIDKWILEDEVKTIDNLKREAAIYSFKKNQRV